MKLDGYSLLLPEGILDYFDVINVIEDSTQIVIYLEEKNRINVKPNFIIVKAKRRQPERLSSFLYAVRDSNPGPID